MFAEISDMMGIEIYTDKGLILGIVNDFVINTETKKVEGLLVGEPNPLLVEHSRSVSIPFRWVDAFGDVILLKYFPRFVPTSPIPARISLWKKAADEVIRTTEEVTVSTEKKLEREVKKAGKTIKRKFKKSKF